LIRTVALLTIILAGLGACGPSPQQQAFASQLEQKCRAGDLVACHQRDGDTIEVARLEAACSRNNLQACQAVSNYRIQQQRLQNQGTADILANISPMNSQPAIQYPTYQAPQLQPIGRPRQSTYIYCNQLGTYVTSCR
jgi:hypothetical protein